MENEVTYKNMVITVVKNGYLVNNATYRGEVVDLTDTYVFEDIEGLREFLEEKLVKPRFNFLQEVRKALRKKK